MTRSTTTRTTISSPRDPATRYAVAVASGRLLAGPLVRAACKRHLADIESGADRGLYWDRAAVARVIGFFAKVLRLPDGEHAGEPFVLRPWQAFVAGSLFGWTRGRGGPRRFRTGYVETGKGPLALGTPIPTPSGWSTMGDIAVGDLVFDERGEPCLVVGVSDVFHNRPCYRIRFSDGCEIIADASHTWRTAALRSGGKPGPKPADAPRKAGYATRTTREIARTLRLPASASVHPQAIWNHRIDVCGPLDLPTAKLPIDPYTLGCWLGDGDSDCARITIGDGDLELLDHLAEAGTGAGPRKGDKARAGRYRLGGTGTARGSSAPYSLNATLRACRLLGNKRIPADYLRASVPQRMALLQGLMDTDGSAAEGGDCELGLSSPDLVGDTVELIRTLGYKVGISEGDAKIAGRVVGQRWRIKFRAYAERPVFKLARKVARLRPRPPTRPLSLGRMIVGCDPIDSVPVRCITVDSPSHLFLAGEGMIPTHNSGKSPLGAGIGLYMLTADDEHGAECYAAAVTRDQAKIPFRDAVRMVERSPALSRRLQKSGDRDVFNLAYLETGSYFRPISSEGRGLDGKRVHYGLIDEVHEHPSDIVIEKITAGVKGRRQPIILEITNSGVDRTTICYQHHEYSERVLNGLIEDDEWFAYICALDDGDNPFEDEACWPKANPSLGFTIQLDYLRKQVREARGMPAKASLVRRLNFCEWVGAANPAIDEDMWRACEAEFDEDELLGEEPIGALDLSGTNDLSALSRVYKPDRRGVIHAVVEFWTPADTMAERGARDRVPYALWAEQGYVTATPGRSVDYAFVAQRISELQVERGLRRIVYDPYRIKYLERELDAIGCEIELVPHGQGYARSADSGLWMPRSVELLEEYIGKRLLRVQRNPALAFAAASAIHVSDAKANRIYDKRRSTGRIDGVVVLAMGVGGLLTIDQEPEFNVRRLIG